MYGPEQYSMRGEEYLHLGKTIFTISHCSFNFLRTNRDQQQIIYYLHNPSSPDDFFYKYTGN